MREQRIELSGGRLRYREWGDGAAPAVVFIHGVLVNGSLWRKVAPRVGATRRAIVPDWPLGAHRDAMGGADCSVQGVARLVNEFLEAKDLRDVTLVGNDSGGAIAQLVAADTPERVGRLVLTPCDALEVFPPKRFAYLSALPHVPGMTALLAASMRFVPPLCRLPIAYGSLSRERIPAEVLRDWVEPAAKDAAVRRDLEAFLSSVRPEVTLGVAERLRAFEKPTLLLWSDNPLFPLSLAKRLAERLPDAALAVVPEAGVFVGEDQPERVAERIAAFAGARPEARLAS